MKKLNQLLKGVDVLGKRGDMNKTISGISYDSRKVTSGHCFVALKGFKQDGLAFVPHAIKMGASAIISEEPWDKKNSEIPWIQVKDGRYGLSKLSANFYNNPTGDMYMVGVTGTNGKTTVTRLIQAILKTRVNTAMVGTLGMDSPSIKKDGGLTTPEALDLMAFFSEAKSEGVEAAVMEVSSVGLHLNRVADIHFSQAVFTNFSGDHLDFHQSMDAYFNSKLLLFRQLDLQDWAVINGDDPKSEKIIDAIQSNYLTYGFSPECDVKPISYSLSLKGIEAEIQSPMGKININSPLIGKVNLSNILAAVASAVIKGLQLKEIADAIKNFFPVKGRLDLAYQNDFSILIDYAHTDQALAGLLSSLREITENRIILVFGAGGSRDKTKRPRMGKTASTLADWVVVTSDNPRQEDPNKIIDDIVDGFEPGFNNYTIEADREQAISKAIGMAISGDMIVLAGKGHEDYQIFADRTIHFDDYEVVQRMIKGFHA